MTQRIFQIVLPALLLVGLFTLTNCNRVKNPIQEYTERVFPLETGQSRIYFVIDTTYNTQDTVVDTYYRQEVVGEKEEDLRGRESFRLTSYRSEVEFGKDYKWVLDRTSTLYKDEQYAEQTIENKRYLLMKFPVYPGVKWNGNLFNGIGEQDYKYQTIDSTLKVQGVWYNPLVVVLESLPSDTTSFVKYRLAYTAYAPDIGKVIKYDLTKIKDGPGGEFNPARSYTHIEQLVP